MHAYRYVQLAGRMDYFRMDEGYMHQRPKSNWRFVSVTYFQFQFPLFVCFYSMDEGQLN